jgi:DNA repair exonuclease SbcCD ATPase subunit
MGRLEEVREHIRLERKSLAEKEAELSDRLGGLKAYIAHLEVLLQKAMNASSNLVLEEVIRLGELEVRTRPGFFRMNKYTVQKGVEEKLESARKELEEILSEIEEVKRRKEEVNICPDCAGEGRVKKLEYVREERIVRPIMKIRECPLCGGKGRIE